MILLDPIRVREAPASSSNGQRCFLLMFGLHSWIPRMWFEVASLMMLLWEILSRLAFRSGVSAGIVDSQDIISSRRSLSSAGDFSLRWLLLAAMIMPPGLWDSVVNRVEALRTDEG